MKVKLCCDKFIKESKIIHNGIYNYSKFVYSHHAIKSTIICPIHGEFLQTPNEHLGGSGCIKCGHIMASKAKAINTINQFLNKAPNIYNNKYNYDKFEYIDRDSKGIIICPIHGEFLQTAAKHLRGSECLKCSPIGYSKTKDGYIYILKISHMNSTFLGYGKTNYPEQRLVQNKRILLKHNAIIIGEPIIIIKVGNGKLATEIESAIIKKFNPMYTVIPSFKRENTSVDNLENLLKFVNQYEIH